MDNGTKYNIMLKRISLISMVLMLVGFLATAQNNTANKKFDRDSTNFENSEFRKNNFSIMKNQKSGGDWWNPDTVYIYRYEIERYIYSYNQQGLLIMELMQYWQNDTWKHGGQCTYIYDANNNMQTKLHENWGNWPWEIYSKYTYTYDSKNNLLTELVEDKSDNTWINNRQLLMTYDENNNLLTQLRQSWNQNYDTWSNNTLNTYTYDSNNNLQKRFIQTYESDTWRNFSQYSYTYDSDNNLLTDFYQVWADNNSGWLDIFLYTYTYDSNNNLQSELGDQFDSTTELSTFLYDRNNNLLEQLIQTMQNGNLVNKSKITNTYDQQNNLLMYLREIWENNNWIDDLQKSWTYDENDNCILVENFSFIDGAWHPADIPIDLYQNNMQSSFYYNAHKVTASYKKVTETTSTEYLVLTPISIYPNPTSGLLNITSEEHNIRMISIFDLSGVRMFETKNTTFDISHFSAGVYVVQIVTEKGIVTKKIVKK